MRHIRVPICQVDDGTPDRMTELACFDLATPDIATLHPETALDALEATTQEIGTTILRRLLHARWDEMDAALVARHCCPGWLAHPWLKARGRAVDTAPGHRASARCDQAASLGWSWRL